MTGLKKILQSSFLLALLGLMASPARAIDLADAPLFSSVSVPGNLALALSVEYPTATTPAYNSSYTASSTFIGYFDPEKCYRYITQTPVENSYFDPYGAATNHACASATTSLQLWSGNYLNWASMQTLDTFRWVLTGGYRSVDTETETRLTKTYAWYNGYFDDKTNSSGVSGATPFSWGSVKTRVRALGTAIYITGSGNVDGSAITNYSGQNSAEPATISTTTRVCDNRGRNCRNETTSVDNPSYANSAVVYRLYVNVRVCASSALKEVNCKAYGSNYKPEGLMQGYSDRLRYSAFGYFNQDGNSRNGGVLRSPMKFIGPTHPVPGSGSVTNSVGEWSSTTGIMGTNPDGATTFSDSNFSVSISNSGVMNYLNKFGYFSQRYKSNDPVSELYYAVTRYFRNKGNVTEYTSLAGAGSANTAASWLDGFPAIKDWQDPILYSCQKNFILGIGDVYTHEDSSIPGGAGQVAALAADLSPTGSTDSTPDGLTKNVVVSTDMVGLLEGATSNLSSQTSRTYYIAGLAYDMHTRDIRTDLTGLQNINTYWLDVHENNYYRHKNQYWLAAKYGGFKIPTNFAPYAAGKSTTTLPVENWYSSTDVLPTGGTRYENADTYSTDASPNPTDRRPDNYFPGNSPALMKAGLEAAFDKIAQEASDPVTVTALSSPSPRQTSSGNANYQSIYNPKNWTAEINAQTVSYAADGTPTFTPVWSARDTLDLAAYASRKIVTRCASAFRAFDTNMPSDCTAPLAMVTGAGAAHTTTNYINYLRGDTSLANGTTYRARAYRLGDIIGSRITAVGAPDLPLAERYNPGYSAFQRTYASRKTVIYVGANDGMMHAFDGTVTTGSTGAELFAYVPGLVYGDTTTGPVTGLASLGKPNFTHHPLVDATPNSFDVDFSRTYSGSSSSSSSSAVSSASSSTTADSVSSASSSSSVANNWRTVLIGGLGKGGKGYYALDITNPGDWTSTSAVVGKGLWEFTHTHMGYSYGDALMVKTRKYGWVVVLTSGYNNDDGKGYFFFVHPQTGALLETVSTGTGAGTGSTSEPLNLAHASAFVPDYKDGTADAIYAGDLQGNVWRVDLRGTDPATAYSTPSKIAELVHGNVGQPVTTRPLIEIEPNSQKRYVLIGTGRLLADSDIASSQTQSFYAIIDGQSTFGAFYGGTTTLPGTQAFPLHRVDLEANTDLLAGISSTPAATMGWYFDLGAAANSVAERINVTPAANNGIVGFAANLPNGNVCDPAGTSRTFAVAIGTGKTVLRSGNAYVASVSNTSVVTDIAFVNIGGKNRLLAGTASGTVVNVPGEFSAGSTLKSLNWRVLPTVD